MMSINADNNAVPVLNSVNAVFHVEDSDITLKNSLTGGFITSSDSIFEIYSSKINDISEKNKILMDLKGSGTAVLKNNSFLPDTNIIRRTPGISVIND